jgi:hypothetical protein
MYVCFNMKKLLLIILIILGTACRLSSQDNIDTTADNRDQNLDIYLDCMSCDIPYFKTNFISVNYVKDRMESDVYILVTTMATGSGGTEYTIQLDGKKRFGMHRDTIVFSVSADATEDVRRTLLLKYTQLGLVPFLMKTPSKKRLNLFIDENTEMNSGHSKQDPWRNWNFEIYAGGYVNSSKTYKGYGFNGTVYISKVTQELKLESRNQFRLTEERYQFYDNDDSLISSNFLSQQSFSSSNLIVKSLGNHFSAGGFISLLRSDYSNLDFLVAVGPKVEYNIYKYAEATNKQFRFLYGITYQYSDYHELTIYDQLTEHRFSHDLSINAGYVDEWGTIDAGIRGTSYLNDWSQYSIGANASVNVNLGKGLSVNLSGSCSYVQDQIGLRKDPGEPGKYIPGTREYRSDFNYSISIGISFRFGSKNNNVVNPRMW